ncbi:RagB/SusD family nutrient uptake outer membrane protein [Fulvivirgaceae bacterium BMA12]|uniref:RagB/SusD family nutrient uptake outer membrane protein n=1 Tax=Agaribacillus aureus TaxID=3051825 RepID=A0ABT8LF13_9BACT|nr:RagB/SusD family nutrient uptake outer membrane protein [Fulvivirgaceae bacterium BMA12]
MKIFKNITILTVLIALFSCEEYLDVVPDNVATIDNAFFDRVQARKYLFTCYSYLPNFASMNSNPALFGGDEFWVIPELRRRHFSNVQNLALGFQNANDPYLNYYEGSLNASSALYQGIRVCNTFIDRIDEVPDIDSNERSQWKAEAKLLKAYYHFYLMRMYGPIPLVDENIPISAEPEEIKSIRRPFDECVNFVVDLIDQAASDLPNVVQDQIDDMGRITKPIALAIKAKVLVTAASPLFNGNPDYISFANSGGELLFSSGEDIEKWKMAADAALIAIQEAEEAGHTLFELNDPSLNNFSEFIVRELNLRGRVTERWNSEIIWGDSRNSGTTNTLQRYGQARLINGVGNAVPQALAPTLRIAKQYYTSNGVPIDEDITWSGRDIFAYRVAGADDHLMVRPGEEIPELHFDRESRFYADLGFDRGAWFGQGRLDESDPYYVYARVGEISGKKAIDEYSITGYYAKKLVYYKNAFSTGNNYSVTNYAFPIIRLADLYLLYAEALNESGEVSQAQAWIDKVRERAGLAGVVESWNNFAINTSKPSTQEGLRDIIQQERLIEMSMEGHRFWDLRRWKKAIELMNAPIQGWNTDSGESKEEFYTVIDLHDQKFDMKDYLWPLRTFILTVNTNLVQNPGW